MGLPANPRVRRLLESEISAFEVEGLPGGAGHLEESAVAHGMKASGSAPVSDRNQAAPNCNSYRVRSILGSELFDQILDMEINGVSVIAYICSGDISDYAIHRI